MCNDTAPSDLGNILIMGLSKSLKTEDKSIFPRSKVKRPILSSGIFNHFMGRESPNKDGLEGIDLFQHDENFGLASQF